jgi:tape measure domain-containing protein
VRASTFTTYFNSELAPGSLQVFDKLTDTAVSRFGTIARAAEAASRATAGVIGGTGAAGRGAAQSRELRSLADAQRAIARESASATRASTANATATRNQGREARQAARENHGLARSLQATATSLNIVQGPLGPLAGRVSAIANALEELTGFRLGLAGVGAGLFAIGRAGNTYTLLQSKLVPFYDSQLAANRAMDEAIRISERARAPLESSVALYARLASVANEYGISQMRIARTTELASKAATISGGTPALQKAGLEQFAQAVGNGRLNGDELVSIMTNIPQLAMAIARGFENVDGTIGTTLGSLRKLGEEGQLTTEKILAAIDRSGSEIEAKFARIPVTLTTAGNAFSREATVMVGRLDQAVGFTSTLAQTIMIVAENLRGAVGLAVALGAAFAAPRVAAGIGGIAKSIDGVIERTVHASRRVKELDAAWLADLRAAKASADARVAALNREQQEIRETILLLERQRASARRDFVRASPSEGFAGSERRMAAALNEERTAVRNLITERRRLQIINGALSESYGVAERATVSLDRATTNVSKRMGALRSAASSLVGFMGGPWGVAFTAATTALYFLATAESEAEKNARLLEDAQRKLAAAIDFNTGKILEQNAAKLAGLKLDRVRGQDAARSNYLAARGELSSVRDQIRGAVRGATFLGPATFGGRRVQDLSGAERKAYDLLDRYARRDPSLSVSAVVSQIQALAKEEPKLRKVADSVAELGAKVASAAQENNKFIGSARLLEGQNTPQARELAEKGYISAPRGSARGGVGRTKAQLAADAQAFAARSELERARADLSKIKADGKQTGETDDAYVERLGLAIQRVRDLTEAEKAARKARTAGAAAARKEEREAEAAAKKAEAARKREEEFAQRAGERRNDILGQWSEEPKAIVKAMDQIDDLQRLVDKRVDGVAFIGKTAAEIEKIKEINPLGTGIYTQAMADGDARRIEQGVRQPMRELLEDQARQVEIARLVLQGREAEARALQTAYDLYDRIGEVSQEQYEQQVGYEQQQERINDLLARRERIVAVIQDLVDGARDSFEQFLMDLPERGGGAVTDLWKSLQQQIWRISARGITERLFADADEKVRALLSGRNSVDQAIHQFSGSIGKAETSTDRLGTALSGLADQVLAERDRMAGTPTSDVGATATNAAAVALNNAAGAVLPGFLGSLLPFIGDTERYASNDDAVITGARRPTAAAPITMGSLPGTAGIAKALGQSIFGNIGQMLGIKSDNKFFAKMGDVFGGALKGAGEGAIASGFAKAIGIKQNETGAAIGGAIGNFLPIPGGSIIGGLLGGTIGSLFQKPKWGSASVSLNQWGEVVGGDGRGRGGEQIKAASGAAGSVAEGVNQIMETLGASISGLPGITIGTWDGKARVALTNTSEPLHAKSKAGKAGLIKDFGEGGEQEAIAFAIRYAIEKGVITGVSQASINILKSGQDLQQALNKALAIESIPKRLMQRTDPVRYAVTELNSEFEKLVQYLKEGGATAEQFADAQKLYELERAEAIEQATKQAASAIDQFLKDMVGGQSSPLNKRTVYDNAAAELNKFKADIMSGKTVDQNDLLGAARNFQDASRALFGSSQSFFSDFESLRALLERARDNAGITDVKTLPASPFATDVDVQNKIAQLQQGQLSATQDQTAQLASRLDTLIRMLGSGGGGSGSPNPIDLLPNFMREAYQ